ncbi:hypothetical protein [Cellulomonas rhizosphaerae]|nr:hypothetical protein [Cellulomonas rhizosphaerae]
MTRRRSLLDRYLAWRIRRGLRNDAGLGDITDADWCRAGKALPRAGKGH